ncbi:MAG: hypothetical protein MJ109_02250 [Kiritimatiellae bacterium]|nr:hypothetical protein [Kiritimatiellia bacterium]
MFDFITSMDSGINPAAEGVAAPSVESAFIASLPPIAGPISEETIARFQAAMEKPLADNAMLQQALETMIKSDKPVVSDRAQNKVINEAPIIPTTEDAKISESPVIEKPIVVSVKPTVVVENPQVVVTETPKVFERTVTFGAEEIPEVAVKNDAPIIPTTEDTKITEVIKPVVVETVVAETQKASESSVTLVAKEKPVLATEAPILTIENSIVVVEKPQVVVTETPKVFEHSVTFGAEDIPEVAVKNEAPIIPATENTKITETIKPVAVETVVAETQKTSEHSVSFVAKEEPVVKVATVKVEDETQPEEVTIAALPQGVAPEAIARPIEVKTPEVAPVVAASVEAKVEAVTAAEVLVEAANAVADTMLVSPGLMRGEGEIIVQLKQDVLSGTELKIAVQSGTMTVEFAPTVEKIATLLEQNQGSLVQVLSERVGRYNIVMNVRPIHEKGSRHART